jgi:hypothetical protein
VIDKRRVLIGVLQGTFRSGWFWWLRQRSEVRAEKFLQTLSDSSRKRNASELRDSCGRWFVLLYLVKNVEWAHQVLNDWIAKPEQNLPELRGGLIIALDIVLPQDQSEEAQAKLCAAVAPDEVNRLMIGWWETLDGLSVSRSIIENYRGRLWATPKMVQL